MGIYQSRTVQWKYVTGCIREKKQNVLWCVICITVFKFMWINCCYCWFTFDYSCFIIFMRNTTLWKCSAKLIALNNLLKERLKHNKKKITLRRFSAPSLIFSSLRISRRICSLISSSFCWTMVSERSRLCPRPRRSATSWPLASPWKRTGRRRKKMKIGM